VYVVTDTERVETMKPVKERELTIKFNADTSPKLRWKFKPHQSEIVVMYPYQQCIIFNCFFVCVCVCVCVCVIGCSR